MVSPWRSTRRPKIFWATRAKAGTSFAGKVAPMVIWAAAGSAMTIFSLVNVFSKMMVASYPPAQLFFIRGFGAIASLMPFLARDNFAAVRNVPRPGLQALRMMLSVSDGMSAAQLARECMVTPQTMATVLTNLEKAGLVVREPSELHQKVVVNRATRAGRTVARKADKAALHVEGALSAEFTPDELAQFEEYLERAIALLGSLGSAP